MVKKLLYLTLTVIMTLAIMVGCAPTAVAPGSDTAGGGSRSDYVEIPEMKDGAASEPEEASNLTVTYLPQGYAVLQSAGQSVLLGGCSADDVDSVVEAMTKLGIEKLNYIIVPNAVESRFSGVKEVMEDIPAGLVIVPQTNAITPKYETFLDDIGGLNTLGIAAGAAFNVGTCHITPVAPIVEEGDDPMDTSLILKVDCGDTSFLFADDATQREADTLLSESTDITANVIFANSRGTSTLSHAVLRLISPKDMVVSNNCAATPDVSEFGTEFHSLSDSPLTVTSNGKEVSFSDNL